MPARRWWRGGPARAARRASHPVTIILGSAEAAIAGQEIPASFPGLSFERGTLDPGNAGVPGYLFSPANTPLVTLFRSTGLRSLRIGGGSVDQKAPAGIGRDGFTGIDSLFAFAGAAGVTVIYTLRLLRPSGWAAGELRSVNARIAGYIWARYRERLASFAIGNEPDWHAFHSYPGRVRDPAISEQVPGVPGSAYASYLAAWRRHADAIAEAAPGAPLCGPDTGGYSRETFTPDPRAGVSWTERFAGDEAGSGRIAEVTQHYYVGADPGRATARQAIRNMLSPEWVTGTQARSQPGRTRYTPYPWLHASHLAPVAALGLRCRLTESNDYLGGVAGASDALAAALWALDYLHWWAALGASGVNFHNKQWLRTGTIVPGPGGPAEGYAVTPKAYAIRAFGLGSAGMPRPAEIRNPDRVNLTAYRTGATGEDCLTIINKTSGPEAADAAVTIVAPGAEAARAEVMALAGDPPCDAGAAGATLGGARITAGRPWEGTWSALPPGPQVSLTVPASTAAIVRIGYAPAPQARQGAGA